MWETQIEFQYSRFSLAQTTDIWGMSQQMGDLSLSFPLSQTKINYSKIWKTYLPTFLLPSKLYGPTSFPASLSFFFNLYTVMHTLPHLPLREISGSSAIKFHNKALKNGEKLLDNISHT